MSSGEHQDASARFPRLAPDRDPTALPLSPQEGFLLSRIDGQTPISVLREIAGMSPEEVDLCLESWELQGIIAVDVRTPARRPKPLRREAARASAAAPKTLDPSLVDPSLDLPTDVQRRILEFELRLDHPYHELLGVARDADARQIKRAYFGLSKEYHPDRYFRRRIGHFAERLDRIFKKVLEAYELLSDPTTRAEIEKSLRAAPEPSRPPPPEEGAAQAGGAPRRPLSKIELLRARMPFRIPEAVLNERRQKAEQFFQASRIQLERAQWLEAAANIRLAIAFDPVNGKYKQAFGDVQARASEMRARQMLAQADSSADGSQQKEALRLYEEALLYKPWDPEINHKAASVSAAVGELDRALEYAERAIEQRPDVGAYHRTLGVVQKKLGHHGHAVQALEKALELDAADHEARTLLHQMKGRTRSSLGGKR